MPELIFIAGCNAAGKSTFIRSRLNELSIEVNSTFHFLENSFFQFVLAKSTNNVLQTVSIG